MALTNTTYLLQTVGPAATPGPCAPCYAAATPLMYQHAFAVTSITVEINPSIQPGLNGSTETITSLTSVNGVLLPPGAQVIDMIGSHPSATTVTRTEDLTWEDGGNTFTWPTVYYMYPSLVLAMGQVAGITASNTQYWPSDLDSPFTVANTTCSSPTVTRNIAMPSDYGQAWFNVSNKSYDGDLRFGYSIPEGILSSFDKATAVRSQLGSIPLKDCLIYRQRPSAVVGFTVWVECWADNSSTLQRWSNASTTCSTYTRSFLKPPEDGRAGYSLQQAILLVTKTPEPVTAGPDVDPVGSEGFAPQAEQRTAARSSLSSPTVVPIALPQEVPVRSLPSRTPDPRTMLDESISEGLSSSYAMQASDRPDIHTMALPNILESSLPLLYDPTTMKGEPAVSPEQSFLPDGLSIPSQTMLPAEHLSAITVVKRPSLTLMRSESDIRINGQLIPAATITINGELVSRLPGGTAVVLGSSTIVLADGQATTIGSASMTEEVSVSHNGDTLVIGSSTLVPGGVITYAGQIISLASDGSTVRVGGATPAMRTAFEFSLHTMDALQGLSYLTYGVSDRAQATGTTYDGISSEPQATGTLHSVSSTRDSRTLTSTKGVSTPTKWSSEGEHACSRFHVRGLFCILLITMLML